MCSILSNQSSVQVQPWGSINGKDVKKFILKNKIGQEVSIINYGATITNIRTPDKNNQLADIVLGFDNIEGYLASNNPYFGATVGRVANRIGKAKFTLDGINYKVGKNKGNNTLHGGFRGWNSKIWEAIVMNNSVVMTLLSEDGDEGFPGAVIASVSFKFNDDGELNIGMKAFATRATPINLTNHSYFNLAGHFEFNRKNQIFGWVHLRNNAPYIPGQSTNADEVYKHEIQLNADRWTVTDSESIPTGEIRSVENSIMDLRKPTVLGEVINKVSGGGFDYNFCLPESDTRKIKFVAKALHPISGRFIEVHSNQPGVQFYTSNFLPDKNSTGIFGKAGKLYFKHAAFCFETQNYPDAINHTNFPDSVIRPDNVYQHIVIYKLGVQK